MRRRHERRLLFRRKRRFIGIRRLHLFRDFVQHLLRALHDSRHFDQLIIRERFERKHAERLGFVSLDVVHDGFKNGHDVAERFSTRRRRRDDDGPPGARGVDGGALMRIQL